MAHLTYLAKNHLHYYGSFSLAQSTQQPLCKHFVTPHGYIAYLPSRSWLGFSTPVLVLGEPCCDMAQWETVLTAFLKKHPRVAFIQISEKLARVLKNIFGFYLVPFGVEHTIDLPTFTYNWNKRPNLVRYKNKFNKLGYVVNDVSFDDTYKPLCQQLSKEWLAHKRHRYPNQSFLTRPLTYQNDNNVRVFVLEHQQQVAAFLTLDPLYQQQRIMGYLINHLRYHPLAPSGSNYALIEGVIQQLQTEKISSLSLGLAPFNSPGSFDSDIDYLTYFLTKLYQQNTFLYNFNGIANMKASFQANQQLSYIAVQSRFPLCAGLKLLAAFLFGKWV
ncbi:hypothetical protein DID76_01485 [Candidatus Marinamargulisbacteria bacterium SCGC AG-414-C22]|nr:hypothetical protein DID76_01485 [Candidatus Marinamargulisbacteria bacterium SCGC AG-414-C22]